MASWLQVKFSKLQDLSWRSYLQSIYSEKFPSTRFFLPEKTGWRSSTDWLRLMHFCVCVCLPFHRQFVRSWKTLVFVQTGFWAFSAGWVLLQDPKRPRHSTPGKNVPRTFFVMASSSSSSSRCKKTNTRSFSWQDLNHWSRISRGWMAEWLITSLGIS